jgi:hypothetical protein
LAFPVFDWFLIADGEPRAAIACAIAAGAPIIDGSSNNWQDA